MARHVCRSVGLNDQEIVTGDDIAGLDDGALGHVAEQASVFARVSPAQKNRIILALKRRGHVVGYMGDGINDAPSLHTADVGISVMAATDVARETADIILGERSLRVLHRGILEGRRASGNMMKYLLMGTSSNFGNMFSMAAASVFLPFLPMLPTQILLNNFLYDVAQITIPTDNVDEAYLRRPQRWDMSVIRDFMLFIGPISSVFDFLTFYVLFGYFHAGERAVSHRVVCGIPGHADAGAVRHSHHGQSAPQPAESRADGHRAADRSHRRDAASDAARRRAGVHRAAAFVSGLPAGGDGDVSRAGGCSPSDGWWCGWIASRISRRPRR